MAVFQTTPAEELIFVGPAADRMLVELGVPKEQLLASLESGLISRMLCNENNALNAEGSYGWHSTVRQLREALVLPGSEWRRADPEGVALLVNDKRKLCIAFATGDKATGLGHLTPRFKRKKKWLKKLASIGAEPNLELFDEVYNTENFEEFQDYQFWILLVYADDGLLSAELSLISVYLSGSETNLKWPKRIVLPQVTAGDVDEPEPEYESPDEIDFEVTKKSG